MSENTPSSGAGTDPAAVSDDVLADTDAGFDPRTSFQVDITPRGIGTAARDYVSRVRSGDPGALPAILGLVVLGLAFTVTTPNFLTAVNVGNLMSQASYTVMTALGLIFVLLIGEIDLAAVATGAVAAGFAAQSLASGDLHTAVGTGVWLSLIVLLVVAALLAAWQRVWVATVIVALGVIVGVAGFANSNVVLAFVFAIAIGTAVGVINGVLTAKVGIPSFIVTLGMLLALTGVTLYATNSQSIRTDKYGLWFGLTHYNMATWAGWLVFAILVVGYAAVTLIRSNRRAAAGLSHDELALVLVRVGILALVGGYVVWWLNQDRSSNLTPIMGVPWALSVPLVLVVGFTVFLARTSWGRHLYAIGGNEEAARRAGIAVDSVKIGAFAICGAMAAGGGLFLADFSGGAQPGVNTNALLYAVAAAVIGGTSLFGGRGKPRDALIGAFVIAMIPNGIQLHPDLKIQVVQVITGIVLLIAAAVDAISRRRAARS